ncbi:MAG: SMC-Scp complex subunit ScpB [Clostridiaceae bacterium]|jgi:segregation and condensation protein B|nr:SMC-Scp complex subunit ScpB [Clostridiaceae bacterium]
MNDLREIESILEAVLFTAGDSVSLEKLSEIVDQDRKTTASILSNLEMKYRNSHRGIMLRQLGTSYQLCTKPEYEQYIAALGTSRKKQGLSQAAYEVLAIIAWHQPVTRAQVEQIRGVNSDSVIINLMEKNLIEETGRQDSPGKPRLYGTTEEFLRVFGFSSMNDLPQVEMHEIQTVMDKIPID